MEAPWTNRPPGGGGPPGPLGPLGPPGGGGRPGPLVHQETQTQAHQDQLGAMDPQDHQDPLEEEVHLDPQAHKAPTTPRRPRGYTGLGLRVQAAGVPALMGNITLDTTALDNTVLQLGQSMHQLIVQQQQQN